MIDESKYQETLRTLLEVPGEQACIAMFLADFRPMTPPAASGDNMTSQEICDALEDICQCSTNQVARAMTALGYRLHINEYQGYEWAMRPIDKQENQPSM